MTRNKLDMLNCSIANALDLIGEWWTILILREAFFGTRRFEDFQQHLGIARNILTARLRKLCDSGVLERTPIKEGAKRHEYRLTRMGRDLQPTLIALTQWGDRWLHASNGAPVKFIERATGEEIADVSVQTKDGRKLEARELAMVPGPGATEETQERLRLMRIAWEKRNETQENRYKE
jgi:DNA-binding HxlR family transcriptional regulator